MNVIRRRILPVVVALITALTLTACGGDPKSADEPSPSKTKQPAPKFQQLAKEQLAGALLTIDDLAAGYSQDPPEKPSSMTYCDYKPVVEPNTTVDRGFTRGTDFSGEYLKVEIRQFDSTEAAASRFEQTQNVLKKCRKETIGGETTTRTLMSAPQVGYRAFGVKSGSANGIDTFTNYILAGPSIIAVSGFGITSMDMEGLTLTTRKQTHSYQDTAQGLEAP